MGLAKQIQFLSDKDGEKAFAVVPIDVFYDWQKVYEEYSDIQAYDKAVSAEEEFVDHDSFFKEIEEERKQSQ